MLGGSSILTIEEAMRSSKTLRARWLTSLCCGVLIGLGCEGLAPTAPGTPTAPSDPVQTGVQITSPSDGDMFSEGESVPFAATAENDDGIDVSDDIEWTSDRDGDIGEGSSFMTTNLSVGTHQITATWVDFEGDPLGDDSITVTITAAPVVPSLRFTKQFVNDPVVAGDTVILQFTIDNLDPDNGVTDLSFTDDLGAVTPGLVAVDVPEPDACGAGSFFDVGSVLTLESGNLPPAGSCSFMVTLAVPETIGTFTNRTTDLRAGEIFDAAPPATDDLTVLLPGPTVVDGTYGPGTFTRGPDTCTPPFFLPSFIATATVSGGGTQLAIGENEIRLSNCSIVNSVGECSGVGMVGSEAAGWDVGLMFDANGELVVAEQIRLLLRGNCGGTFTSDPLSKQ